MFVHRPLLISRLLLNNSHTDLHVFHGDRIPTGACLVVSNHRSIWDAPVLMAALDRPVHFACHHYMKHAPVLREMVWLLEGFTLEAPGRRQRELFWQGEAFLRSRQCVGIFPEGADPMVELTPPCQLGKFYRGFAHLALRSQAEDLAVLPVAIASQVESVSFPVPLKLLYLVDPSEPRFNREGWHPFITYRRANVFVGRPFWIRPSLRDAYQGKGAKTVVSDLTAYCREEIAGLLAQGCS